MAFKLIRQRDTGWLNAAPLLPPHTGGNPLIRRVGHETVLSVHGATLTAAPAATALPLGIKPSTHTVVVFPYVPGAAAGSRVVLSSTSGAQQWLGYVSGNQLYGEIRWTAQDQWPDMAALAAMGVA